MVTPVPTAYGTFQPDLTTHLKVPEVMHRRQHRLFTEE